jgi:hypothetical protein
MEGTSEPQRCKGCESKVRSRDPRPPIFELMTPISQGWKSHQTDEKKARLTKIPDKPKI